MPRKEVITNPQPLEARVLRLEDAVYGDGEGLLSRLARLEEWAAEMRGSLATLKWLIPILTAVVAPLLATLVSVALSAALR
jgi:hypothetical protein